VLDLQTVQSNLQNHINSNISNFSIKTKEESFLLRLLRKTEDTTTITLYPTIYFSKDNLPPHNSTDATINYIKLLCHEYVHLSDRKKLWQLFNLLYFSPQIFAILSILSILNMWWILCVLLLAPFPSIGRAILEYRGYKMTLAVEYWLTGQSYSISHVVNQFELSTYYFMFPFTKFMTARFTKFMEKVENEEELSLIYNEIKQVIHLQQQ
jgi:hypothetical protein